MEQTTRHFARPSTGTIVLALLTGLIVLVLLFPGSGNAAAPPTCYSVFGYVVPCDAWVSWVAAAVTVGLVGVGLWTVDRRTR